MNRLTERQQEVLDFIQQQQAAEGCPPTIREISAHFGFGSPNAAMAHVTALRQKGYLRTSLGRARGLLPVQPASPRIPAHRLRSIPIFGAIPAGYPEHRAQDDEGALIVDLESLGIRPSARTFALRVRGDSMTGKGVLDGDIAVIEHGIEPRTGDIVAAMIDGQVTLKTFVLQRGKPFLRAENPRYPHLIPREELQVQGVMVALVRRRR